MARKLAISNTVLVPVTLTINDAGNVKTHSFKLTCNRVDQARLRVVTNSDGLASEFMAEVTTDWSGQRLVLEDDDTPSPFSQEALADLMKIPGLPVLCMSKYLEEVVAKAKN